MTYITELDTYQIKKIAGKMPDNSAVVNIDDQIFALNVSSGVWSASRHGGSSLELILAKDTNGQILTQINRNLVARELYKIAEPDGADWRLISSQTREKYIRMQDAGVKP